MEQSDRGSSIGTWSATEWAFLASVACCALFLVTEAVEKTKPLLLRGLNESESVVGAAGQPRQVDMDRLLDLINQGRLSEHEALFYRRLSASSQDRAAEGVGGEPSEGGRTTGNMNGLPDVSRVPSAPSQ